ncbi:MAG: 23S rRNA (guanosine(2251)-2'-O)-methyltransferase RlmB [Actinomycetota bacterium]
MSDDSSIVSGRRPVVELLRAGRPAERILVARESASAQAMREIRRLADGLAVPVRIVPRSEVEQAAAGTNHQGVVALTGRYRYTPLEKLLSAPNAALLFCDGITDPHNLGSLLRSADGAGFSGVVIPARRAAGVTATVRRVSAGAAEIVPVARVINLARAVDQAREAGVWVVGLDATAERDLFHAESVEPPLGLVLGAEDKGISPNVRKRCDDLVRIPSRGRLGSLNVAVAGAIAMFEVARRS